MPAKEPIIEIGRGDTSITKGQVTEMHINQVYSIEPTTLGILTPSKVLGTIDRDFNVSTNSKSADLIPGIGLLASAIHKGIEKSETLSNMFLHGNYADQSLKPDASPREEMSINERLEIKQELNQYSEMDIKRQMEAQNADYSQAPEMDNSYSSDLSNYVNSDELEGIQNIGP